ncbi:MAG: hypothetical protein RLZZ04_98 [Cyanobacteriota bacterium]|jgi:DNA-binding XRE family transcriptional regulator
MISSRKSQINPEKIPMKWIREELGMTQMELATALGVATSKLSAAENGKSEPVFTMKQVKILCSLLGKGIDEMPEYLGRDYLTK